MPTSSTTAGSHAITCTRPGQPPIARTNRSIVIGSIECGSIVSPSSISDGTSSGSTSITYSVPGSPPCLDYVDDHQRAVAAHDLVREVEPAGADVHHADAGRQLALGQPPRHLGAERVVLQPRVADAGDEDLLLELRGHAGTTSTSAGLKYR